MKRRELIRELERAGCELLRHGKRHDIYRIRPTDGKRRFLATAKSPIACAGSSGGNWASQIATVQAET